MHGQVQRVEGDHRTVHTGQGEGLDRGHVAVEGRRSGGHD